jgi:hypothetical protein
VADWHLAELDDALRAAGWTIADFLPGDGYRTSAVWVITRGRRQKRLAFEGLTEEGVALPIEHAYACKVEGNRGALYFSRKTSRRWRNELEQFVAALAA